MAMAKVLGTVDAPGESFSIRMRARRFAKFEGLVSPLPRPIRIVDVGGTSWFWEQCGWVDRDDVEITLINVQSEAQRHRNVVSLDGGFERLESFERGSFDVAFSNSVIEHLFTIERQRRMAELMRDAAPRYWVQTPNFWFPIEPHFHVP